MRRAVLVLLCLGFFLNSCDARSGQGSRSIFFAVRNDPPAVVEFSPDFQPARAIPLPLPPECSLFNTYASPMGPWIAVELSCPFGQTVDLLNTDTGAIKPAFPDSDSHYLSWASDGRSVYLKVDTLARPQVLRLEVNGRQEFMSIPGLTYDLAPVPNQGDFSFTVTSGLGYGSETWLARPDGSPIRQLLADPANIISFIRWSPDGGRIAFIKFPDSQTPYPPGELWVSNADGSNSRFVSAADAGHGFAPAWSPDGRRLAFVFRDNQGEAGVEQADRELVSDLYLADVSSGSVSRLTRFEEARVETPAWSPDGNTLAVTVILNDKMNVYIVNSASGQFRSVLAEPACCAGWLDK